MNVKIYKNTDENLIKEWTELWEKSSHAHFFNSYAWFAVCKEIFEPKSIRIACVYKHNELLAIYPLFEQKKYGVKTYGNPGGRFADKFCLLILDLDENVIHELLKILKTFTVSIEEVSELFYPWFSSSGFVRSPLVEETSILRLGDDPYRYMHKKKKRKMLNKYNRNFSNTKYIRFNGTDVKRNLKYVEQIDTKSRKKLSGKEVTSDGKQYELFKNLAEKFPQYLTLDVLFVKDKPIAYELGILSKNKEIGYQTAFDEEFKYFEPGRIILVYIWESMRKEGIEIYDWARGTNILKQDFSEYFEKQFKFYTANKLVLSLWYLLDYSKDLILNNDSLYRTYLFFKNRLINFPG